MRIDPKVAGQLPVFYSYVCVDMAALADNSTMVGAMSRFGRMSNEEARRVFRYGSGPEVKIVDMEDPSARLDPNAVNIHVRLAESFERGNDFWTTDYGKRVHIVGVLMLEQYVAYRAGSHMSRAFLKALYGDVHPIPKASSGKAIQNAAASVLGSP